MKIAIWHNLPSGGAKRALYDLVVGLSARGHTLEAWRPPTADSAFLPLSDVIPEHVVPLGPRPMAPGSLKRAMLDRYAPGLGQLDALEQHARCAAMQIAEQNFDVLFAHPCRVTRVPSIGRYARLPSVLYLQEPNRWLYEARPTLPWVGDGTRRRGALVRTATDIARLHALRELARHELASALAFDTMLVNSYFSRESVGRAYGVNARVAYLGVDTAIFRDRHERRADFVLGVGSITRNKGIEFAIESVARTSGAAPRPPLVWVANTSSDERYLRSLQALARSRGVCLDVRLGISDADLVGLLNWAALVLYVPYLEPFGLVPIEAGACGAPVVGIAEGGLRETIVHNQTGLLVERDPAAVAGAINRLRSDEHLARRLGQAAAQRVRDVWTTRHAVDRIEAHLLGAARAG